MESGPGKQAERVRSTYAWWGKSGLYNPATAVTLLGKERMIRRQCVEQLGLHEGRPGDRHCLRHGEEPSLSRRSRRRSRGRGRRGHRTGNDREGAPAGACPRMGQCYADRGRCGRNRSPERSFDGVICTLGFSVMPHYEKAIRRAVSLLKEGGRIAVCDASPLRGMCALFNFIVVPIYRRAACWDPRKDVLGALEKYAAGLDVRRFNGGSIFIASGRRRRYS